jgi:hypothetical protein
MWTSTGQSEGSPVTFYERYGFERTGDFHGKRPCSGWRSPSTSVSDEPMGLKLCVSALARVSVRNVPRTNGGPADRFSSPLTFGV